MPILSLRLPAVSASEFSTAGRYVAGDRLQVPLLNTEKIDRNQSFDDWERMLRLIEDWRLISPKGSISFEN